MEAVFKCAAVAVAGAVLSLVVRRQSGEFGALLSMGVVVLLAGMALELMEPVMTFAESLQQTAQLGQNVVAPVMKTLAIGVLTELGKNLCEDAGEKTIGGVLHLVGGVAAFYVMLPLMQSVLELMETLL